jgi:hypothetical protein
MSPIGDIQTCCLVSRSAMLSTSIDRAKRTSTPSAMNAPNVIIAVMSGKRQNNHSIVAADTVRIAKKATMPIREDDAELAMPIPPDALTPIGTVYLGSMRTLYSKPFNFGTSELTLFEVHESAAVSVLLNAYTIAVYPSMLSRRQ